MLERSKSSAASNKRKSFGKEEQDGLRHGVEGKPVVHQTGRVGERLEERPNHV